MTRGRPAGQQAGLHHRRLAAAGRPVDQADGERVRRFDPRLPEPHRFGQAVAVPWPVQEAEEEVRVFRVEGAQSLGDDADEPGAAGRSGSCGLREHRGLLSGIRDAGDVGSLRGVGVELQLVGELPAGRVTVRRPRGEGPQADPLQFPRDPGDDPAERHRLIVGDPPHDGEVEGSPSPNGWVAAHQLVQVTIPRLKMSVRPSTRCPSPRTCSGLI